MLPFQEQGGCELLVAWRRSLLVALVADPPPTFFFALPFCILGILHQPPGSQGATAAAKDPVLGLMVGWPVAGSFLAKTEPLLDCGGVGRTWVQVSQQELPLCSLETPGLSRELAGRAWPRKAPLSPSPGLHQNAAVVWALWKVFTIIVDWNYSDGLWFYNGLATKGAFAHFLTLILKAEQNRHWGKQEPEPWGGGESKLCSFGELARLLLSMHDTPPPPPASYSQPDSLKSSLSDIFSG